MSNSSVTGSVKFFNAAKGFGFIAPEDGGKDVFVPAASIAASGLSRLKAGQRVSFDLEPDAKGPKAVKLTVLEDAPAPTHAPSQAPSQAPAHVPAAGHAEVRQPARPAKNIISVYINTATANGAADDVLTALEDAGETHRLVEVAAASRDELKTLSLLLREADQSLVRRFDPLFLALQLDDRFISESDFWTGITEHPSLVNGPVVATAGKARICKSAADVKAFLGAGSQAATQVRPPPDKPKGISPRMAALMRGESLPPRPVSLPPEPPEEKPPAKTLTKFAAEPKPAAKAVEKTPLKAAAKAPAPAPAKAKPAATPKAAATPKPASVKKAAAKVAQKPKAAPAKAKKKK